MANKWTNEEIDFLKDNYGVMPINELCEYLGRSKPSIIHKADRENITAPRQWSDDEIQYLKDNYKTKTYKQLSEHLNRTKSAIDLKINRLGLVKSQYSYNHSFFKTIDTEYKAYWCGFIMADGCVSRNKENNSCEISIKIQASDGEHLKKFNTALSGNIPVTYFDKKSTLPIGNKVVITKMSQIRIYSEEMFHDLEKYGVVPNKSLIKDFPENIPDSLISHYIRGYFDGNGTICISGGKNKPDSKKYVNCFFTTGSIKFAEGLKCKLEQFGIKTSAVYTSTISKALKLSINGMENVHNFLNFIYNNSNVYLERKFQKKIYLYEITDMEQRLLRQAEKSVYSRNESSGKENGKPETVTRMEGCTKDTVTCRA